MRRPATQGIPADTTGYLVERGGIVHTRYPRHPADGRRTRTSDGARALLGDTQPQPCAECYPVKAKRGDKRATGKGAPSPPWPGDVGVASRDGGGSE